MRYRRWIERPDEHGTGVTEPSDRDERLGEAIEAYLALVEQGTAPDPEAFAGRYPDLEDDILRGARGPGAGPAAWSAARLTGPGPARSARVGPADRRLPDRPRAGPGRHGDVYEAVHVGLDRPVALKVLGTHAAPDSIGRRRFLNEARTAAGLHHTHIVPVFDVGQVGGLCYYAMQRIEGSGLDRVLRYLRRDPAAAGSSQGRPLGTADAASSSQSSAG